MWSAILAAQVRVDVGTALGFTTANAAFRELPGVLDHDKLLHTAFMHYV